MIFGSSHSKNVMTFSGHYLHTLLLHLCTSIDSCQQCLLLPTGLSSEVTMAAATKEKLAKSVSKHPAIEEPKAPEKAGPLSSSRVFLLGAVIVLFATIGFYSIPGMIDEKASGSHFVNSVYCAVMTLTT